MNPLVFDSFALAVLFEGQPGREIVEAHLVHAVENGYTHLMSAINFGEFYYARANEHGFEQAEFDKEIFESFPIELVVPELDQIMDAAHYKGGGGISYADCFAADLAIVRGLPVLTGDQEFKRLQELGLKVEWLPKNRV